MEPIIMPCGCTMMFLDDVESQKLDRDSFVVHQKPRQLLESYEDFFLTQVATGFNPTRLLEIGVKPGGSLAYWRKRLPACGVVGVDINLQIPQKTKDHFDHIGGVEFHTMNGTSGDMLSLGKFDMIVDDGGHSFADITASYSLLWSMVNPGGYYIIEDWYSAYSDSPKLIAHLACGGQAPITDTWATTDISPIAPYKLMAWKHIIALQKPL